jgi:hypothetical protein
MAPVRDGCSGYFRRSPTVLLSNWPKNPRDCRYEIAIAGKVNTFVGEYPVPIVSRQIMFCIVPAIVIVTSPVAHFHEVTKNRCARQRSTSICAKNAEKSLKNRFSENLLSGFPLSCIAISS